MTTAAELIREAYLISNVLDPTEEVAGFYATIGLNVLNRLINQWSSLPTYLQTYSTEEIELKANTATYTVTPTVTQMLEGHLIDSNSVQTGLTEINLKEKNTLNYVLSETSPTRPYKVYIEKIIENVPPPTIQTGSTIWFYPVPDQAYTATLYLKKALGTLTQSQTITEVSTAYEMPLIYQMGKNLSIIFSSILSPAFNEEYDRLMTELKAANKQDMTVMNSNPFGFYGRRYRPWSAYAG